MADAKVLIVEDEVIVAMGLERSLGSFGYNVVGLATKGEDAVRMAGELMPDLALIDINLDDKIDGIDVAERIGRQWDIPVVYLTSYTGDETLSRAIRTNPYGYLTKPARPREVYTTIETVLQKHRAVKAERALESGRKKFMAVLNSIPFPVCILSPGEEDKAPRIVYCNELLMSITGMNFSELSELDPGILFGYEFTGSFFDEVQSRGFRCDTTLKSADNGEISGEISAGVAEYNDKKYPVILFREDEKASESVYRTSPGEKPAEIKPLIDSIKKPLNAIIAISGLGGSVELEEISRNAEQINNLIYGFEK